MTSVDVILDCSSSSSMINVPSGSIAKKAFIIGDASDKIALFAYKIRSISIKSDD
jgi:hypothetical protein